MNQEKLDAMAKANGFDSYKELMELMYRATDTKDPVEYAAFEKWLTDDCSKTGLLKLLNDRLNNVRKALDRRKGQG